MIKKCFSQSLNNDGRVAFNEKQCLTPKQKEQARKNIGALGKGEIPEGFVEEAPKDNKEYARKNGDWTVISSSSSVSKIFKNVDEMKSAKLNDGDVVETSGFYSVNDGGACKYQIQSTGTANEMDLIALNNGKIAKALFIREAYPEQIGYEVKNSASVAADLTPYLSRLLSLNVVKIRFHAKSYPYYMKSPLEITKHNVVFSGDLGTFSGYSSRIEYVPNSSVTEDYCIKINSRRVTFENLYINDNPTRTHTCFKTDNPNGSHEGYKFINLNISLFDIGFSLGGAVNWQHIFNKVTCNQCRIGLYTQNTFFMNNLLECYFGCTECDILSESEYNAVVFTNCNFECLNRCVDFSYWKDDPYLSAKPYTLSDCKFQSCSFEFHTPADVPANVSGCFVRVDDFVNCTLDFDSTNFSLLKMQVAGITSTRCMSFGKNTRATFISCKGPEFQEWNENKHFFDETKPPKQICGALTLINNHNIKAPLYTDAYLPCIKENDYAIKFGTNSNIDKTFTDMKDGISLFNMDDGCFYTKSADQMIRVSNPPSNFIRVGNELYSYITIGNRKWITRNLRLVTTNSHIKFTKIAGLRDEWGCYYPFSDQAEISSKLPSGWRIPTKSDFDDLIAALPGSSGSDKSHSVQSTDYSEGFPGATNTTGLNIPPASNYTNEQYIRAYLMGSTGRLCLVVNQNGILTYDYSSDAPNINPTLRICADL